MYGRFASSKFAARVGVNAIPVKHEGIEEHAI